MPYSGIAEHSATKQAASLSREWECVAFPASMHQKERSTYNRGRSMTRKYRFSNCSEFEKLRYTSYIEKLVVIRAMCPNAQVLTASDSIQSSV